jgi:hypothetical protein
MIILNTKNETAAHPFRSNADMVRHYFKELMADGQERSTKEINEYIHEKSDGQGVDGKRLTDETIHSAIWYMFRQDHDVSYTQTRKGFYQKSTANDMVENAKNNLCAVAVRKLDTVTRAIKNAESPGLPEKEKEKLVSLKTAILDAIDGVRQTIGEEGFGRELMTEDNISIDSELIIEDDHINAYVAIWFDADKRLGLNTEGTDEYVNLYADYYPENGRLDVFYIHRRPDAELIAQNPVEDITAGEKELIIRLMKDEGMDELIAEMKNEPESGMSMQ